MRRFWKRLPRQISLKALFLIVTFCCVVAERGGAVWMEARRAEARLGDISEANAKRSEGVTDLHVALAFREKCLAVCQVPFTDREKVVEAYNIELYFAIAASSKGPNDFKYDAADAVERFLIAEYDDWYDQKFPDRRREAELQALLVTAIPAARKARDEWCESERLARIENRSSRK